MQRNPYEVLGVKEGASQEEIKAAYREQVKKYHPDKHADNPLQELAEIKLQEINEAYDLLTKNPGHKHTGGSSGGRSAGGSSNQPNNSNEFAQIRVNIDRGNLMGAEHMLKNLPPNCAEWYFLKGMVSWRKGWMDDAFTNIQTASAMEPGNFEYRQALNQMRGGAQQYQGGAYNRGYGNNDQMCQLCAGLACLDCMCDCI